MFNYLESILSGGGPFAAGADGAELPRAARPRGLGAAVPGSLLQRHHASVSELGAGGASRWLVWWLQWIPLVRSTLCPKKIVLTRLFFLSFGWMSMSAVAFVILGLGSGLSIDR